MPKTENDDADDKDNNADNNAVSAIQLMKKKQQQREEEEDNNSDTPKVYKRRVVDFSSGEEEFLPSHQRLTHKGGYAHTKMSRLKISQANSGNVPWNKGRNRTSDARAKISAGVRARNQATLLNKLEKLGMTEDEWKASKKKIKLIRERVRRARNAVAKEAQLRETRRLARREQEEKERALRKLMAANEGIEEDDDDETDVGSDEELVEMSAHEHKISGQNDEHSRAEDKVGLFL
jgi:hypothetical protein